MSLSGRRSLLWRVVPGERRDFAAAFAAVTLMRLGPPSEWLEVIGAEENAGFAILGAGAREARSVDTWSSRPVIVVPPSTAAEAIGEADAGAVGGVTVGVALRSVRIDPLKCAARLLGRGKCSPVQRRVCPLYGGQLDNARGPWRERYRGAVRIATWNVNSVKQRLPRLLPWLDERRPDVVCLQETKLADDAFADLLGDELAERGYEVAAARRGGVERRRDPVARRGSTTSSPGLAGGAGLPAPGGARGVGHVRRHPGGLGLRAERARAGLGPLPVQARLARGAAGDGRRRPGGDGRLRRHEHRPDRRGRVRSRRLRRPDPRDARPSGRRWRSCRRSACATSSATAGPTSACSPTGTTARACSTRTSGCGSTWCWPARGRRPRQGGVGRPPGPQGQAARATTRR